MEYQGTNGTIYLVEETKIASGGEGTIYAVQGNPTVVAKIFREGKRTVQREQKLRIMVAKKITKKQLTYFTWPQDVLYDTEGFAGYIMPKVSGMKTLTELYSDDEYDLKCRLTAAYNMCASVEAIHEVGQVCGDLNSLNILVNLNENDPNYCHVTLVDTDSYHVVTANADYRCEVGMSDYIAPEVQKKMGNGVTLRNAPLPTYTMETDRFALAVHVFSLLMNGCHPFASAKQMGDINETLSEQRNKAVVAPSVVAPQPIDNIKDGFFPFTQYRKGITIPVYAPEFNSLPTSLQVLFQRTFCDGYYDPRKRVTASEWADVLSQINKKGFNTCEKGHMKFVDAPLCPVCQIEKKLERLYQLYTSQGSSSVEENSIHEEKGTQGSAENITCQASYGGNNGKVVRQQFGGNNSAGQMTGAGEEPPKSFWDKFINVIKIIEAMGYLLFAFLFLWLILATLL